MIVFNPKLRFFRARRSSGGRGVDSARNTFVAVPRRANKKIAASWIAKEKAAEGPRNGEAALAGLLDCAEQATMPFELALVLAADARAPVCWHPHLDAVPLVPA